MTNPTAFADACSAESDVDHCVALLDALNHEVRTRGITLATQLAFIAYVVAEMENQSPEPGVVVPALEVMIRRNVQTLELCRPGAAGSA